LAHSRDVPQEEHLIWPIEWGGPLGEHNEVMLCLNAHHTVNRAMDIMKHHRTITPVDGRYLHGFDHRTLYLARLGYLCAMSATLPPYPLPNPTPDPQQHRR
jgi:hypothetical protein